MHKKHLKILFVARDKFPPFRVDVAVLFGKEMVRKGHQIDWVLQSEADCTKGYKTRWAGGEVWVGPTHNGRRILDRLKKHLRGFWHNVRQVNLLANRKYDAIQLKDRFFASIVFLSMARCARVKFFYWLSYPFAEASLHEYKTGAARYPLIYLLRGVIYKFMLYKIIMKHADHIFVQSEQMKKDIHAEGIAENKMTAIPMGFEDGSLATDAHESHALAKAPVEARIVYIGTLNRLRKIDFVIRMFAKVIKEVPEARLYLVGTADTAEDIELLKRAAQNLNILQDVVFTGFMERRKALRIVKSANVCISPFYPTPVLNSTSPTKLIEYMVLGKPVVANDHPEQRLVIEKSGGGICVPYREKDFAEAIVYLLTHPDMGKKMGARGRSWALHNRSYSKIVELVEATYYQRIQSP